MAPAPVDTAIIQGLAKFGNLGILCGEGLPLIHGYLHPVLNYLAHFPSL
jgi:hypothetical protein